MGLVTVLFKLFNWVPVLFGLKVAGLASVAQVPDVVGSERPAWVEPKAHRVSSGVIETFLKSTSTDIKAIQTDRARSTGFVMQPLPANVQRPVSRLKSPKAKTVQSACYMPAQVVQSNRPASRAALTRNGKKVAKRVVTLRSRGKTPSPTSEIIKFPHRPDVRLSAMNKAA